MYILEGLAERRQKLQAELEGVELLERLIREANLSQEEETRMALAAGGIHPAIIDRLLRDELKATSAALSSGDE